MRLDLLPAELLQQILLEHLRLRYRKTLAMMGARLSDLESGLKDASPKRITETRSQIIRKAVNGCRCQRPDYAHFYADCEVRPLTPPRMGALSRAINTWSRVSPDFHDGLRFVLRCLYE